MPQKSTQTPAAAPTDGQAPADDIEDDYDRRVDDALFSLVRYWDENPNVREVVAGRAKPLRDRLDALLHITNDAAPSAAARPARDTDGDT